MLKALAPEGGFPVVYDSVGKDTYRLGLEVLAPLGTFASFGNASGAIEAVAPQDLAMHGSLLFHPPDFGDLYGQSRLVAAIIGQGFAPGRKRGFVG